MPKNDSPTNNSLYTDDALGESGNVRRMSGAGKIAGRVALSVASIFTVGNAIAPNSASASTGERVEATETKRKVDNFDLKIGLRSWRILVGHVNFSESENMDPAMNGLGADILEYFTSQLNNLKNPDTAQTTDNSFQALQDTVIFLQDEEEVSVIRQWVLFGVKDNPDDPANPLFTPDALDPTYNDYYGLYIDKNGVWQRFSLGGSNVGMSGIPGNKMVGIAMRDGSKVKITPGKIEPNSFTADGLVLKTSDGEDVVFGPAETYRNIKQAAKATLLGTHFQPVTLGGIAGSVNK